MFDFKNCNCGKSYINLNERKINNYTVCACVCDIKVVVLSYKYVSDAYLARFPSYNFTTSGCSIPHNLFELIIKSIAMFEVNLCKGLLLILTVD